MIRAGTVIPLSNQSIDTKEQHDISNLRAKIAITFDTGRIQFIKVLSDIDDNIQDTGEFNIEYGDSISIPTECIRQRGMSDEPQAVSTKSLGEGQLLRYLHQSGLLLYECSSSPVLALILDKSGDIIDSFEFVPHILSKDIFGSTGYHITGPYTQWTELGRISRNGSMYNRVSFIGRSARMNHPKIIYAEFNENSTRVSEIKSAQFSLTLSINTSIEGFVAFSAPILAGNLSGMFIDNINNHIEERIFLLSISSNGSISLFNEELLSSYESNDQNKNNYPGPEINRRRALSDSVLSQNKKEIDSIKVISKEENRKQINNLPAFPLTMFEELINVSEKAELIFGGDCVKDPVITKRRLSMNSGEFIISPSSEGGTLTVSLRRPERSMSSILSSRLQQRLTSSERNNADFEYNSVDVDKLAIVAVRILLGSTSTEYLPQQISVMGRRIKLREKVKRWYDIPLTDEEIILGHKSGSVTISIGASLDTTSSPPLIDSVEVFAKELSHLTSCFSARTKPNNIHCLNEQEEVEEQTRRCLDTSILAIAHLYDLVDNKVDLSSQIDIETINRLIQITALDSPEEDNVRSHVISLVKSMEKNQNTMQFLLDEGTIHGILNIEKDISCKKIGETSIPYQWRDKIISRLNDCLEVAISIAKDRPANYRNVIEKLVSSGETEFSVALQAQRILDNFHNKKLATKVSPKLTQLALFESMATDCVPTINFAGLQLIGEILRNHNEAIVKESCIKLAETLKEIQSFDKVQAFQCDSCMVFPITGTRYTLEDKNIDLCMSCFETGNEYAKLKNFRSETPVLVNDRKLQMECGKVMSCSQIKQMTTKLVPENIQEQVDKANALRQEEKLNSMTNEVNDEDDPDLAMALKMSLEVQPDHNNEPENRSISYNIQINLITKLLADIEESLSKENLIIHHPIPIIDLLLSLVTQCVSSEDQVSFGKKMCDVICCNVLSLIERYQSKPTELGFTRKLKIPLFIYLRTLEGLATGQNTIRTIISNTKSDNNEDEPLIKRVEQPVLERNKDKTDPRYVCETHGIPAVRRR